MPLKKPFEDQYKIGDLIYGLSDVRGKYPYLYQKYQVLLKCKGEPVWAIDQYAATYAELDYARASATMLPKNQKNYLQALSNHPKYKSVFIDRSFTMTSRGYRQIVLHPKNINRKCKAGLFWAAEMEKDLTIHFLLDKIDFFEVILKCNKNDHVHMNFKSYINHCITPALGDVECYDDLGYKGAIQCKSITGSELRWVYRNRNNPKVQKVIQFWLKGKPCPPPWEPEFDIISGKRIADLWSNYKPKKEYVEATLVPVNYSRGHLSGIFDFIFNCLKGS